MPAKPRFRRDVFLFSNVYNPLVPRQPTKTILDGQLLSTYINLPISRQRELAEPIGTNRETVLNDLVDLSGFGAFF
jgi:cleavage and polyadenylation specificity factor subunit 1